jgi:hypothetical protein
MQRRQVLAAAAASLVPIKLMAHHGWSTFDTTRPIYLEGKVVKVSWANPHAALGLEVDPGLKLPADLASRQVPTQQTSFDAPGTLSKAVLPTRKDKQWTLELAPLARMNAWKVPEPKVGDKISVLGYTFPAERGEAIARVEVLFISGQAYPLRSGPA